MSDPSCAPQRIETGNGTLHQGYLKTETFDEAGTYAYSCRFHPFMKGQIVIR